MVTDRGSTSTGVGGESTVQIVNLTDTGFTVIWLSEVKEQGYISYGTAATSLSSEASDERDGLTNKGTYYVHSVSLSRLQPDTSYFFEVVSGEDTYNNNGSKYKVKTFSTLNSPPPFQSVTGVINGIPDHNEAVVVAYIKDEDDSGSQGESNKVSTLVDDNGKWILSIADSRVQDGSSYFEYTSGDSMYIDILSTVSTNTKTESMAGVTDGDIEISLGADSSSSIGYTRVELLGNYGILGYTSGINPDLVSDPTDPSYSIDLGTETPKTSIFDNVVYLILLSLGLLTTGIVIYTTNMTKPKRKGKMVKSL
jgi:hypothetical protein